MFVLTFTGAHLMGRLADQGLANTLGLATLRHGTHPLSWVSIHLFGALPQMGGNRTGGDHGQGCDYQNRGRFYFAKGSRVPYVSFISRRYSVRMLPKTYSMTATFNLLRSIYCPFIIAKITGIVTGLLLPTIKFRFPQNEVENMQNDRTVPIELACSTDEWVHPLKIGTIGTVWQSFTYRTPIRMIQNPSRVITGVAQLALVGVASYFMVQSFPVFVLAHSTSIIAGAALGMF